LQGHGLSRLRCGTPALSLGHWGGALMDVAVRGWMLPTHLQAGGFRSSNPDIVPGKTIVVGTSGYGLHAKVKKHPTHLILVRAATYYEPPGALSRATRTPAVASCTWHSLPPPEALASGQACRFRARRRATPPLGSNPPKGCDEACCVSFWMRCAHSERTLADVGGAAHRPPRRTRARSWARSSWRWCVRPAHQPLRLAPHCIIRCQLACERVWRSRLSAVQYGASCVGRDQRGAPHKGNAFAGPVAIDTCSGHE
jgi:hypothetical protein